MPSDNYANTLAGVAIFARDMYDENAQYMKGDLTHETKTLVEGRMYAYADVIEQITRRRIDGDLDGLAAREIIEYLERQ